MTKTKIYNKGKGWYIKAHNLSRDDFAYMPVTFKENEPEYIPDSNGITEAVIEVKEWYFYSYKRTMRMGVKEYDLISHSNGKEIKKYH